MDGHCLESKQVPNPGCCASVSMGIGYLTSEPMEADGNCFAERGQYPLTQESTFNHVRDPYRYIP